MFKTLMIVALMVGTGLSWGMSANVQTTSSQETPVACYQRSRYGLATERPSLEEKTINCG